MGTNNRSKQSTGARVGLIVLLLCAGLVQAACPPAGESIASLQSMKAIKWRAPEADGVASRQTLALNLVDCLGDANPALRDGLAFDGLQAMMRGRQLTEPTLQALRGRLLTTLEAPPDAAGFRQPFSALVLAEVARADRMQPFLTNDQRNQLIERSAAYLAGVRDYRGFDEREGWRHGVAHGADLMLQLSLNPLLQRAHVDMLLAAIAAQVAPAGDHFYRYGEGERLMAPVLYLARRNWLLTDDWDRWLLALTDRLPKGQRNTQAALAARHNLAGFLSALYVSIQEGGNAEPARKLLPGLRNAIKLID